MDIKNSLKIVFDNLEYFDEVKNSAKEKPQEAEVIAIGKKDENGKAVPFEVKVGDKVLINKYGGIEVKIDDVKYTIVHEDKILSIVS